MWICMYDAFLSIVQKDCEPHELLVRARREGDIEKVFPDAQVAVVTNADYLYRAVVSKADVIAAMTIEIDDIDYGNFKNEVRDNALHNAYLDIWTRMSRLQPLPPYSGAGSRKRRGKHTTG